MERYDVLCPYVVRQDSVVHGARFGEVLLATDPRAASV